MCGLLGESDEKYDRAQEGERLRRASRDHGRFSTGIEAGGRKDRSECWERMWLEDRRRRYVSVLTDRRFELRRVGAVLTPIPWRVASVVLARMRFRLRLIATRVGCCLVRLHRENFLDHGTRAEEPRDRQEEDKVEPNEWGRWTCAHSLRVARPIFGVQEIGVGASAGAFADLPSRHRQRVWNRRGDTGRRRHGRNLGSGGRDDRPDLFE